MPRLNEVTKHPAIGAKKLASINRENRVQLEKSEWWDQLTSKQQEFLAYYAMLRDAALASRKSGVPIGWMEDEEQEETAFAMCVLAIQHQPAAFAMQVVKEMLPWSIFKLRDIIDDDNEKTSNKLSAIKHLHHLAGMAKPQDGMLAQILQTGDLNVQLWTQGGEQS
jgi:hypothetical protein